ncbi:sensor histidine kinase [Dactylosporangium sp. NPDC051541]|uniref:sensor histidine kinase n=1 Tax=Dactylosporangium sp. NPDC051541 TaxID=3363977 RepID=UPI00379BECF0
MKRLVAWLRVETPAPARLTPWAWAADIILAVLLAIGAVSGAGHQQAQIDDRPYIVEGPFGPRVLPPPYGPEPGAPDYPDLPAIPDDPDAPRFLPDDDGPSGWLFAAAALTALPLAFRRRYPLAAFLVVAGSSFVVYQEHAEPSFAVIASLIAAYSAPMYSRYRNLALLSVVVTTAVAVSDLQDNLPDLPQGLMLFLILSSVGLAANTIHSWRQRARTAEREQAAAARIAVDEERARLARELHDVVTHNVSVMVVQAGAARKVMDAEPEQAREALLAVEAGGRAALTELRQAIGLLTVDDGGADLAPQPGLDQLETLVDRVRETGVPVTLAVAAPPVPPGVGLAAYRVVQEALTNAVKHAAGAAVDIVVSADERALRIDVADTGGVAALGAHGSGRGLAGLRERLTVYGGTLTAGPRPIGGFRVHAEIPLEVGP